MMTFKKYLLIITIGTAFLLSGCATLKAPRSSWAFEKKSPAVRQAALAKIKFWMIDGAFGIKRIGYQPVIANYRWQQFNQGYRIHIVSSLGLYSAEIYRAKNKVTLWKNGTHAMTAHTPEGLMHKALGWSLPLSELTYWIRDMPAPQKQGTYKVRYDDFGHLTALQQDGWTLHYGSFITKDDIDLPQAIVMERYNMSVKIVIKTWTLPMHPLKMPDMVM
ncbi:MAG: outer membrane lipoprotein LolB [Gammaproteobacteria bacterium CG_4_10_14_0_8_um_filter_38_16]|nr:MAG: outer membrane lipoprotein LolB [Gammaproteobacteria bacterium CG_4_10_14_0_8_um_filter_38_16]PJA03919.1 MAG: outer membrane lipoprotein LolB [Gammaproteobacteria bacterium CG_4_10_14_0_2_um_filter_38_22]PJB09753.1 MAG: outer membrane lipoprotein LolB [Gammaproteobacteria bacterium CG_4_9_14_3_um_filter_38_9]